jgi:uncharacterized damage-inducible protein DinB
MIENFILFADYNAEMNARNFNAAHQLTGEELLQDRGAFFGSILGTMNHLIVADTLWLQRIASHPAQFSCLRGIARLPKPDTLNLILFTELNQWYERRVVLDQTIKSLVLEITAAELESILFYHRTDGTPANKRMKDVLLHFFNHQTHHRGQISTLLFQAGVDVGVTDLLSLVPDATSAQ